LRGCLPDQIRVLHRSTVHRDLVRTGFENHFNIGQGGNTTAYGQGDVDYGRHVFHPGKPGLAVLQGCRNIQHGQLIGPFPLIKRSILDRVAGILQINEMNPLHNPAFSHIQARHDRHQTHDCSLSKISR